MIKTGIKITNPLSMPVSVIIKCPTGALRWGNGKETCRIVKPGETLDIPTKGKCEVDITVHIIRYNEVGDKVKIGDGALCIRLPNPKPVPERAPEPEDVKETEEAPLRSLGEMIEDMKNREEVKV